MGNRVSRVYTRTGDDGSTGLGDGSRTGKDSLRVTAYGTVQDADVTRLESVLDALNEPLPPLKEFILPGGGMAAACGHLARTVCRRAERAVVALSREEPIRVQPQHYLNRLSDLLFVISRVLAREGGHGEVLWQHERRPRPKPAT